MRRECGTAWDVEKAGSCGMQRRRLAVCARGASIPRTLRRGGCWHTVTRRLGCLRASSTNQAKSPAAPAVDRSHSKRAPVGCSSPPSPRPPLRPSWGWLAADVLPTTFPSSFSCRGGRQSPAAQPSWRFRCGAYVLMAVFRKDRARTVRFVLSACSCGNGGAVTAVPCTDTASSPPS